MLQRSKTRKMRLTKSITPTDYETEGLILRRGTPFCLNIEFSRDYDESQDEFAIVLTTGKSPKKRNGSYVYIPKASDIEKGESGYQIVSKNGPSVKVKVYTSASCVVGKYNLAIETTSKEGRKRKTSSYDHRRQVYMIFNPWCEDDEVYMESAKDREEYVLNDSGAIWWGGRRPKPWFFGQFTDESFRTAFLLLERVRIDFRDTAREVARLMSAMANDFDDNGILSGRWDGNYGGGKKPWEWSGSAAILKQYYQTKEPVKFGQCWVFSGIVTTLMRALGVPSRSVTNYDSAHDTDNNLTFDKYFDSDGTYLDDESDDSCWNFHVWNECWMARPDLPDGYGGWQAIDATPQEKSHKKYRTGPASLKAIKEGDVNLRYDCKFVFAEVNSDKVYWKKDKETGEFEPVEVDTDAVGHYISTKSVGNSFWPVRQDLTQFYKYPEGSALERIAVKKALKLAKNPVVKDRPKDVKFSLDSAENVNLGENIKAELKMKNTSAKQLTVNATVNAQVVRYDGVALKKLKAQTRETTLDAEKDVSESFEFISADYQAFLDDNPMLRLSVMVQVKETGQIFVKQLIVTVDKPDLEVTLSDNGKKTVSPGDEVSVKVSLKLPEDSRSLTKCELQFEGSALASPVQFDLPNISGETFSVEKTLMIKKKVKDRKRLELLVTLNTKELSGLQGLLVVDLAK